MMKTVEIWLPLKWKEFATLSLTDSELQTYLNGEIMRENTDTYRHWMQSIVVSVVVAVILIVNHIF